MSFRKYGSDPSGSNVHKLESLEARNALKSVKFGETAYDSEIEEKEKVNIWEKKEWSPLDEGDHQPQYADGRSEDGNI